VQSPTQLLPPVEMGTTHNRSAMSVFNTATDNGLQQEGLLLPTREELGARAFDTIRFWMEDGNSQLLSREQALQIAVWGLKSAGAGQEAINSVIADLVELPDNLVGINQTVWPSWAIDYAL
jgi:hypothetical protein